MEKLDLKKHSALLENRPFSFVSTTPFLDFFGYVVEKNSTEEIIVQHPEQVDLYPYLYLPKNILNRENCHIMWVTDEELSALKKEVQIIKTIPLGQELYYRTGDFINPEGSIWHDFRRRINKFKNEYSFSLTDSIAKEDAAYFIDNWISIRKEKNKETSESDINFFKFCLENKDKYDSKVVGVLVNDRIVGVGVGVKFDQDSWVSLHQKVDYKIDGLSRFLTQEQAKVFSECKECSLGGDRLPGVGTFKHELNPTRGIGHYYVITGGRL